MRILAGVEQAGRITEVTDSLKNLQEAAESLRRWSWRSIVSIATACHKLG